MVRGPWAHGQKPWPLDWQTCFTVDPFEVLALSGAFVLNPARGFTRVVTGRAFEQGTNPTDELDHLGNSIYNMLSFGYRMVGEGESLNFSEDEAAFFVEMDLTF